MTNTACISPTCSLISRSYTEVVSPSQGGKGKKGKKGKKKGKDKKEKKGKKKGKKGKKGDDVRQQ